MKETDYRLSTFASIINSFTVDSTTTYQKDYIYSYHFNGNVDSILETILENGDTIKSLHCFDYSEANKLGENYKINKGEVELEIKKLKISANGHIKEVTTYIKNNMQHGYLETKIYDILDYHDFGKIKEVSKYYSFTSFPKINDSLFAKEKLGSRSFFYYDDSNRLKTIVEYEFEESEEQILNKTIDFHYQGGSHLINEIQVSGQSVKSATEHYIVRYDSFGLVKELLKNGSKFTYEVINN